MSHNWVTSGRLVYGPHGQDVALFAHESDAVTAVRAVNELGPLLVEIEGLRAENESLNSGQCVDALVNRIIELNAERTRLLVEVEELRAANGTLRTVIVEHDATRAGLFHQQETLHSAEWQEATRQIGSLQSELTRVTQLGARWAQEREDARRATLLEVREALEIEGDKWSIGSNVRQGIHIASRSVLSALGLEHYSRTGTTTS